uniref:Uncharacterized protein n=1 Tax=Penaeus monodon majanivirus B TaxID=2984272 RepID=A0A9C7C5A1_9VIRU|nr:MAG: hypothetical protein [Penaeus monodon majanivirus B]
MVHKYSKIIRDACQSYDKHITLSNTANVINRDLRNAANQTITKKYHCNILRWAVRGDYQGAVQHLTNKNGFSLSSDNTPNHVTFSDSDNINVQIYVYTNPYFDKEESHMNNLRTNPEPRSR